MDIQKEEDVVQKGSKAIKLILKDLEQLEHDWQRKFEKRFHSLSVAGDIPRADLLPEEIRILKVVDDNEKRSRIMWRKECRKLWDVLKRVKKRVQAVDALLDKERKEVDDYERHQLLFLAEGIEKKATAEIGHELNRFVEVIDKIRAWVMAVRKHDDEIAEKHRELFHNLLVLLKQLDDELGMMHLLLHHTESRLKMFHSAYRRANL